MTIPRNGMVEQRAGFRQVAGSCINRELQSVVERRASCPRGCSDGMESGMTPERSLSTPGQGYSLLMLEMSAEMGSGEGTTEGSDYRWRRQQKATYPASRLD